MSEQETTRLVPPTEPSGSSASSNGALLEVPDVTGAVSWIAARCLAVGALLQGAIDHRGRVQRTGAIGTSPPASAGVFIIEDQTLLALRAGARSAETALAGTTLAIIV